MREFYFLYAAFGVVVSKISASRRVGVKYFVCFCLCASLLFWFAFLYSKVARYGVSDDIDFRSALLSTLLGGHRPDSDGVNNTFKDQSRPAYLFISGFIAYWVIPEQ